MSYLRYGPDVRPIPPEEFILPQQRWRRWLTATLLYLGVIAGWVWWSVIPPKLQPPLAVIPLPDGTELRLIRAIRGPVFPVATDDTYGDRVRVEHNRYPFNTSIKAGQGTVWLVFTQHDPRTQITSAPTVEFLGVQEKDPSFLHEMQLRFEPTYNPPYSIYSMGVVPVLGPEWTVVVMHNGGERLTATILNPFPAPAPVPLSPKSLPQRLHFAAEYKNPNMPTVLGSPAEMTLSGVDFTKFDSYMRRRVRPQVSIAYDGLSEDSFTLIHEFFDSAGNRTEWGVLPFDQSAWAVRVLAVQAAIPDTPTRSPQLLANTTLPIGTAVVSLPVPEALKAKGVTDILFGGAGNYYAFKDNVLSVFPASTPKAKANTVKLNQDKSSNGRQSNVPVLFVLSNEPVISAIKPIFRLRHGEAIYSKGRSLFTSDKGCHLRSYEFENSTAGRITPGTPVILEFAEPVVLEGVFHFPTPTPPNPPGTLMLKSVYPRP